MGSLWGSPPADTVAGTRGYAQVVVSPRVGAGVSHSPFHPMSRRSLSQKRMGVSVSDSSSLLFKLLKGGEQDAASSPRDALLHDGDSVKGHKSRFFELKTNAESKFSCWASALFFPSAKRNWRHTAFFLCTLLVVTVMLLKIMYLGVFPVQDQASQNSEVNF